MSFGFVSNFGFRASNLHFCLTFAARPVEYPFHRSDIFSFTALFHGASHRLSETLNPNSTENFKYVWLDLRVLLGSGIETVDIPAVINLPKVMKIPHRYRVESLNLRARL